MSDLSAIIDIKADASGVEAGIGSAKKSIAGFKGAVIDAGAAASGALEKSGDGGRIASKKVEDATKNIIGSIQRQIAATEAGAKSGADYYRALAGQRGIDVNGLKPYLDQLDAAKAKTLEAATANESFNASLSNLKTAAIAAGAALGAFALFAKKINDGVDAINDLKDATGASIENISALEDIARRTGGSFDTVSAAMIKFNGVLNSAKIGSEAEQVLKALGLSAKELREIDPAEALLKTSQAFAKFADDGNKARGMQELFGKSTKEVAAFLKDLAEKGQLVATVTTRQAEEAEKFNQELFKMQKNVTDVSRSLVGPLVASINEVIKKFKEGRAAGESFFEIATRRYADNVRGFYGMAPANTGGATGSYGEPDLVPVKPKLPALINEPKPARSGGGGGVEKIDPQIKAYQQLVISIREKIAANQEEITIGRKLTDSEKQVLEVQKLLAKGSISARDAVSAKTKALLAEFTAVENVRVANEANLALEKTLREEKYKTVEAIEKANASGFEQNKTLTDEVALIGLSADQQQALTQARLNGVIAQKEQALASLQSEQFYSREQIALEEEIRLLKERAALQGQKFDRSAESEKLSELQKQGAKFATDLESGLTNSLFRAFESGKGFFKSLWDGIKNLFKTTVLKLAIQGVVGGVMGGTGGIASAASSLLGGGGGAGGLSGIGNIASSLGSVGTVASQVIAGGMSIANALGTVAANVTGTGITGLLATNGAFGTAAAGAGAAGIGGSITAALGSIGPVGWAIIAAGAVAAILSGKKDSRFGSQYEYVAGSETRIAGGPNKGVDFGGQMKAQDAVIGAINSLLTRVGSSQQVGNFASGFESSEKGKGFSYAGGTFANGTTFGQGATGLGFQNNRGSKTPEQAIAEYKDELIQATLQALQAATDLPKSIADKLKGVDIDALSGDALKAFVATIDKQITEVESFRTAMQGLPFAQLRDLSFDAAAALLAAGGGLEKLSANLGAYYENFYSEEEKRAQTIASINAATAGSGLDAATATRESFRAIVEAQDRTTEAGLKTYVSLIGVADAFAGIAPAVELAVAAVETISDTLKSLRKESENLAVSLMRAQGNTPGADAAQYGIDTAGLSAVEKAVFDYNAGIKTQIETLNTATSSAADAASAALARQQAVQTERTGLQDQLNGLTDTAAQALTRQRDALDESNRALFDNIQAVKTQQAAAAEALAAQQAAAAVALAAQQAEAQRIAGVAQERTGLQDQLNALTDTAAQALTRQREALDESNRALFDNIQAVKAQKTAAAEAAEAIATAAAKLKEAAKTASALTLSNATAGFSGAQAATNAAAEGIKQAIAAEKARIGLVRDAANQTRTQITGVFTLLRDQVEQLYGSVESTQTQQAGQGGSFIAEALRIAQSGGGLPDQQKLQQAIAAATGGLDDNNFKTKVEADRAKLLLAGQLGQLKDVAGDQLSESERAVKIAEDQLSALELQTDSALQQFNALRGIDTSVLSVGGAVDRLQTALGLELKAQGALVLAALGALKNGGVGSAAAIDKIRASGVKLPTEKRTSISTGAGTSQDVYASTGGAIGVYNQTGIDVFGKDGSSFTGAEALEFIQAKLAANDPLAIYTRAIEAGISAVSLDALAGFAPGTSNKFARENGLPEFRIGTNYVPQDMVAKIHEGEAIVPKAYNPAANGSSNAQLLKAVQALEEKMAQMIDAQERGNESANSSARVLQGQQTRPLLVEMAK